MSVARILIVDDEPGIRQSLREVLEDEGLSVEAVDSGEACLEALERATYSLVLLDIWLPGMDGLETLERLRHLDPVRRPVVVVISGHGNIETAVKATKLGALDFLESRCRSTRSTWPCATPSITGGCCGRTTICAAASSRSTAFWARACR